VRTATRARNLRRSATPSADDEMSDGDHGPTSLLLAAEPRTKQQQATRELEQQRYAVPDRRD
jgi:hypothetical protein